MKNIDVVNSIISKNKNVDVKTVAAINKLYWKTVRRKVSNLESTSIFIRGLLTFTASKYNINRLIIKVIYSIRRVKSNTRYSETTRNAILDKYYRNLKLLLIQRNRLANYYYYEHTR